MAGSFALTARQGHSLTDRIAIAAARLRTEEGVRSRAYNDATGETVTCRPAGNLSIGIGINLENGLDDAETAWLLQHRLGLVDAALRPYAWYADLDEVRASVLLDMGFNLGVQGLLHFPRLLAAAGDGDYVAMAEQCHVADAHLDDTRYAPLRQIILTGVA